ncbi:MAG: mechanosensitive ion channel domain-containing protein [Cellvibrionaceae bacterium]
MFELITPDFSQVEWLVHGCVFALNLILLFFAKPIINRIDPGQDHSIALKIFVTINIFFLIFHGVDIVLMTLNLDYQNLFIKLAYTALCFYVSILVFKIGNAFFRRRFGKAKIFEGELIYQDSYSSRVVELIFLVTIFLFATYTFIKIWGMDSLLETTGIFGIAIGFAALTSSVWAPDILSGLIILNTNILEDGDVVVVDGYKDEYIIHKVSFIYTVLYDIRNNHRTFIRNKKFIESKIDNLSRVASTDGIRKSITYNIAYPNYSKDKEIRVESLKIFNKQVDQLFSMANELAVDKVDLPLKSQKPFEWFLTKTGDYALEYTLFVYLEPVPTTKITSVARKHLLSSLYNINAAVLESSTMVGLELKTPDLLSFHQENTPE